MTPPAQVQGKYPPPSDDEINNCLQRHLPYEIDMLRVAAGRLKEIKGPDWDANIAIEVFCVHARNLIEFVDGRWARQSRDFTANQFANEYTCAVDLEDTRTRINKRIAHLTMERVRGDNKILVGECLGTYNKLETEIARFMACLSPGRRSALSERLNFQAFIVSESMLLNATDTTSAITSFTVVTSRRGERPGK